MYLKKIKINLEAVIANLVIIKFNLISINLNLENLKVDLTIHQFEFISNPNKAIFEFLNNIE